MGTATPEPAAIGGEPFLRSTAQISLITAVARALGFARWIVLGVTIGATYLGNTYQTANWIPNVLFELAAGGVLAAVFVPTFVAELERGRERAQEIASTLANAFLLVSVPLVLAGMLLGRPIMLALTAAVDDPALRAEQVELGAWFLLFFAPQIPLYLLAMVMTGILHAHGRFAAPAVAPALSSIVVIATYLAFRALGPGSEIGTVTRQQLLVLALGTTAGVVALAGCQLPSVWRTGVRWRPVLRLRDPTIRRAVRAGAYGMAFFGVTQVGLLTTLVLANRVRGGVVAYQVGYAFFELPNALVGLPVAVALFPALARHAIRADHEAFAQLISRGARWAMFVSVPAGVGLFVLAGPLSRAVLEARGPAPAAPELVGAAIVGLALGAPAYALSQTLIRSFYARHEPRFSVALNASGMAVFVASAVAVTWWIAPSGPQALLVIGACFAAGQWVAVGAGAAILHTKAPAWRSGADAGFLVASLIRATIMAAAVWTVVRLLADAGALEQLAVGIGAGTLVYLTSAARTPELREATRILVRR